jgi:hypothetical protein
MQAASPARKIIPTFMIRKKHCNFLDIKQISSKVHNFRPQAGKNRRYSKYVTDEQHNRTTTANQDTTA